jgi:pilus assembly protein CpaE
MAETYTANGSARHRIFLSGAWEQLKPLVDALAREHDLELVREHDGDVEAVLHVSDGPDAVGSELTAIQQRSQAPVLLLTSERSPALLERALEHHVADVVLVDGRRPAAACAGVAFAVRKALMAAQLAQHDHESGARVFTIFSPKGGTGKSVTATNLAVTIARDSQRRVLLLDLDVQFGDVAIMLGLEPRWTLHDVVAAPGELDARKLAGFTLRHSAGVDVLAAPERPEEGEALGEADLSRVLEVARGVYDAIVVDTSPYFHGPMLSALDCTDQLLLVSGPDIPTLKNTRLVLDTLERLSFPVDRVRVVFNRASAKESIGAGELAAALDLPVSFELPDDPTVPEGVNRGVPATISHENAPFARAIRKVAAELLGETVDESPSVAAQRFRLSLPRRPRRLVAQPPEVAA